MHEGGTAHVWRSRAGRLCPEAMTSRQLEPGHLLQLGEATPADLQEALERLLSARRATSLYQENHPMAVAARDSAYEAIQLLLRSHSQFAITAQERGLLLNRKLYRQTADTRGLARRMLQRGMRSVTFLAHFDTTELAALISLFEVDPDRLMEQGGARERLRQQGVMGISVTEVQFKGEEDSEEAGKETDARVQALNAEDLIALLADYLLGDRDSIDDTTYDAMIQMLRETRQVVYLLTECVSRAEPAALEGGRAAFVAQLLQRLEALVLERSSDDWEQIKASVREAISRLPPALRPKMLAMELPDWDALRQGMREEQMQGLSQLPALLAQLSHALGALRAVPAEVAKQVADSYAGRDARSFAEPAPTAGRSELGTLLKGISAMHMGALPVKREMADLLDSAGASACGAKAAAVLVDVADREPEADNYSVLATELENRAKGLAGSNLRAALAIVEMFWAHMADVRPDFAWRRIRAKSALDSIGTELIVEITASALANGVCEHLESAARLLAKLGPAGIRRLARLLTAGLPAESESAAADALVEVGEPAVGELARALGAGSSSARVPVVQVLAKIGGQQALAALGQGLKSPDKLVRLAVVQCLGMSAKDAGVDILAQALEDASPIVRESAILALGASKSPRAVEPVARVALQKSMSAQAVAEKCKAVNALASIGTPEAVGVIAAVLRRKVLFRRAANNQVRQAAFQALRSVDREEARTLLRQHGQS